MPRLSTQTLPTYNDSPGENFDELGAPLESLYQQTLPYALPLPHSPPPPRTFYNSRSIEFRVIATKIQSPLSGGRIKQLYFLSHAGQYIGKLTLLWNPWDRISPFHADFQFHEQPSIDMYCGSRQEMMENVEIRYLKLQRTVDFILSQAVAMR